MGSIYDRIASRQAERNQEAAPERAKQRTRRQTGDGIRVYVGGQHIGNAESVSFQVQPPRKGHKDELCNRTACQKPGAYYFNTGTQAYYCLDCACQIRPWSLPDFDLFPGLKPDERESEDVKRFWAKRSAYVEVLESKLGATAAERHASNLFRLS